MAIQLVNIGAAANDGTGDVARTAFQKVNASLQFLNDSVANIGISLQGTKLINGGYFNIPTTYQYFVWADQYVINNVLYTEYISNTVTLTAADATNNRFDVIVINAAGTITVVTGTAAANPTIPVIDTETQLIVTTVLVTAATTAPAEVTTDLAYNENAQVAGGEYNTTASGASVIPDSTEQAESGTISCKFNSAANGANLLLTDDTAHPGADMSVLKLNIYLPTAGNYRIRTTFYNTDYTQLASATITDGVFGFDASIAAAWQTVLIPASAFAGIAAFDYDKIEFLNQRNNSTFFIDNVQIQTGLSEPVTNVPNYTIALSGTELQLLKDAALHSLVNLNNLPINGGAL